MKCALATPLVFVSLLSVVTRVDGLLPCDVRCRRGNKTQVFRQLKNGICTQACMNSSGKVPRGYGCGPCPVFDTSRYNINLALVNVTAQQRSMFAEAAARWERVIKGDLPHVKVDKRIRQESICAPYVPTVIDDILICGAVTYIDGPGKVLGRAGALYDRKDGSNLPLISGMQFDDDDVKTLTRQGNFNSVILHEMGHSFGISSTYWQLHYLQNSSTCEYAVNSAASREWQALTGCKTAIPVEKGGMEGTKCSHWGESCLQNELMTGYLNNQTGILSRMTVGTLQDLGYVVDFNGADSFDITKVNSTCVATCSRGGRRQLGATSKYTPPRPERKLTEALEYAIAYGKNWLNEQSASTAASAASVEASYSFVGDQMVMIWYWEDDGSISSVEVRKQS